MSNLSQDQSLSVLIQAARIGQSKGAYTLEDAKVIAEAISVFVPAKPTEVNEEAKQAPEPSNFQAEAGC